MLLVGLTGGLASGKSTVARLLAERGAVVIDADDLARHAVAPGTPGLERVVEAFGKEVLADDGSLDRRALAALVFDHEDKRVTLEGIVHPEVFRLLHEELAGHRETDAVVVFDAPLIMETGFDEACDVVVVVTAPVEERMARAERDRGMDEREARARISAQIPEADRIERADVVIENGGTVHELRDRVEDLWAGLHARAAAS